ncbi:hypothetical protein MSPP1_002567 [Malassezia sp. CBS 17886]|nr:hypothetical protein MSPP1_002567 [Malassezia sp. CBS 17886]
MLFPQEDSSTVKAWLVHELEPLCDADPDVLADYVLALFKNDSNEQELAAMLNEQLVDFLESGTAPFVQKALDVLRTRAYAIDASDAQSSRKRAVDDDAEAMEEVEEPPKRQAFAGDEPVAAAGLAADAAADAAADTAPSAAATDAPDAAQFSRGRRQPRQHVPKGFCRDYHTVGFCSRGDGCKFQHSDDSIMGPLPNGPFPFPGMPFPPGVMPPFPVGPDGGIPPELAAAFPPGMPMPAPSFPPEQLAMLAASSMRGGRGMQRRGRGRGGRGGFLQPHSAQAPRSQDTLVVENIPPEYLDLSHVNDYFKRFGTITNIDVDKPGSKAVVSFATRAEADNAHKSPDVIFGNRFVKVYFQRLQQPEQPAAPPSKPHYMTEKGANVYLAPELRHAADSAAQERAQVQDTEKHKLLELRRKKQALLNMQIAEQKSLLEKLSDKELTPQGRQSIMSMLQKLGAEIKGGTDSLRREMEADAPQHAAPHPADDAMATEPSTEELQAKLASLRKEAASIGLDASGHAQRGGFRGRGRGYFRWRGGASGNRPMSLDNRTTRVCVSGLAGAADVDKTKTYLQQFGEYDNVDAADGSLAVTFKTRANGERAMRSGTSIPDVGEVNLAWVDLPPKIDMPAPADTADDQLDATDAGQRENWK